MPLAAGRRRGSYAARILRGEDHVGFTLESNCLVTDGRDIYQKADGTPRSMRSMRNAVYDISREPVMMTDGERRYSLAEWQSEIGLDIGTEIIDPRFADIENDDFTITNKEMFEKIGFVPIVGFPATE